MGDFWETMQTAFVVESSIDDVLQGREMGDKTSTSLQDLTDRGRAAAAIDPDQKAGTRVRFVANLGSVLTYADIPDPDMEGTVVTVKTADGITTNQEGRLFVQWDDGKFRPIMAEHLRLTKGSKRSNSVRMVVADLGDISAFFAPAASGRNDELVHKATKDLWSFRQDGDNYVIERLFDETGEPIKV